MATAITKETPLSKYVSKRLEELNKTQREVAAEVGFANQNMIWVIKTGYAKLPLDRVAAMAKALECDLAFLFRLALEQFVSEDAYKDILRAIGSSVSENEQKWIERIRELTDNTDPELTIALDKQLTKALST